MKKVVVLSGAGISAESGLKTFRDSDGLWEGYHVEDVATPEAWKKNPALVLDFYNERRKAALKAIPNEGHLYCKKLEDKFEVAIITQNVDNLHEKAGSKNVLHLHGELFKSRSTKNPNLVFDVEGWSLQLGDTDKNGAQLRPHIVWFGEAVPMMEKAIEIAAEADFFIIVGTSLQVYPAAGLVNYTNPASKIFLVDPAAPEIHIRREITIFKEPATTGMKKVFDLLTQFPT